MKKMIIALTLAFVGLVTQAQNPDLINENWYVDYIVVDGITYDSPIAGFPIINTNIEFTITSCNAVLDPESDSFFADINYDPTLDEFTLINWGITLPGCNNYCVFASHYWDLLTNEGATEITFSYEISTNTDGSHGLLITHSNGNLGAYNNFPPLSIADLEKLSAVIYPNPVSSVLNIDTNHTSVESYKVYDITGKFILSASSFETSIDVSQLSVGLHFLELAYQGKTYIKRFVKK